VLSVLVPRELRCPSLKATELKKVFNVQHLGFKDSRLFENIKESHSASCSPTSASSAFFSILVEENQCKSNRRLSVLTDTFHLSSMQVFSLANTNITRVSQTLLFCPMELLSEFIGYATE